MESKRLNGFAGTMGAGLLGTVITLVVGIIGVRIVNSTLATANFTGLLGTVTGNIPVLLGVGLLVAAVAWAFLR